MGRGWIYLYVRRVWSRYYCGYPFFPVTQTCERDPGRHRRRGQPREASSSGRYWGDLNPAAGRRCRPLPLVHTAHLLPRVFVCFHLLSPSNSHPVAPAWRRADLVFLSLVGLQVAVSAPVFGSDRGVGAPGSRCVPQCSSALKSANVRLIGISARCCFSAQISSH